MNRHHHKAVEWLKEGVRSLYYNSEGMPKGSFYDGKTTISYSDVGFGIDMATFRITCNRAIERGSDDEAMFKRTLRYAIDGLAPTAAVGDVEVKPIIYTRDSTSYDLCVRGAALEQLKTYMRDKSSYISC